MASGFNRQDSGRGMSERGNINPWVRRDAHVNLYPPPLPHNPPPHMPQPPPPPSFRFHDRVPPATVNNFREDISRNPYQANQNSYYNDINRGYERRNNGSEKAIDRDRHFDQHSSSNFSSRREGEYDRYQNERDYRRFPHKNGGKYNQRGRYDEDRRKRRDDRSRKSNSGNDVECISPRPTSPETLSDVSLGSPDITEVPIPQDSPVTLNSSGVEQLTHPGPSQLEQAYNRRMSQNSDSSEISIIPISIATLPASEQVQDDACITKRSSKSYNTPASPDR